MAGIKISALPAAPNAQTTDIYPIVQGGVTYKLTTTQLATVLNDSAVLTAFLPKAGGIMSGAINMGGFQINNMALPSVSTDAATKGYVDSTALSSTTVIAASTGALTVTQAGAGVGATLTNAGAQATFALDGVNPTVGQNVLIKNQASNTQNGIYTVTNVGSGSTNWVLTRATTYDSPSEINDTGSIVVQSGSTLSGTSWYNSTFMVTVDTTAINFAQSGASFPLSMANGGTGAALTASNGGIPYSGASAMALLAGTATAGLALLSGASGAPSWSNLPPITRVNVQTFTSTGAYTYTPTTGTKFAIVKMWGGGGGTGGVAGSASAFTGVSGGGGGGAYYELLCTAANIGAGCTGSVGTGGNAAAGGANNGGNGGDTTFIINGSTWTAGGGGGSNGQTATAAITTNIGGARGALTAGSNATVIQSAAGQAGDYGWGTGGNLAMGGRGGDSLNGGIGGFAFTVNNTTAIGGAGVGVGAGAGGAALANTNASLAGQGGQPGAVIILEFISA